MATTRARLEPSAIRSYEIAAPAMQATCQSPPRERGRKRPLPPPSTSPDKLEKCRTQAQQRRMTQKGLMDELAGLLPFPREVTSQMDTKTVLRLAVCYLRVKSLLAEEGSSPSSSVSESSSVGGWPLVPMDSSGYGGPHSMMTWNPAGVGNGMGTWTSDSLARGILRDLMVEALQGFLMVASCDGTVLYLSESVFTHTGLFQSEHTGKSMYCLIHEEDHSEVREALTSAEAAALSTGDAPCSFFCRLKSKKKNSHLKAPGYKLAYVSGHCKVHQLEPYVACVVHIVSAPSILEIRVEGNAFTTRHDLHMRIIFYDERMRDVLGYSKKDLIGQSLFTLHHHDDLAVTEKCSRKVREKGEAVTGYYRILTRYGTYVWLQTRGTMVMDRRTGKPSQLLCMHFIVDKEKGDQSLNLRNLLAEDTSSHQSITMDPLPVPRPDGKSVNPLSTSAVNPLTTSAVNPPLPTSAINPLPTTADVRPGALSPPSDLTHPPTCGPPRIGPPSHSPLSSSPPDSAPIPPPPGGESKLPTSPYHPPSLSEKMGSGVQHSTAHSVLFDSVQSATAPQKFIHQFPCSQTSRLPFPSSHIPVPQFPACPQSIPPSGPIPSQLQLYPLSRSPSSSSQANTVKDTSSTVPTPFSTPVPSPYWPDETSPSSFGPYSNPNSIASSNPPSSVVNSPQPVQGHAPVAVAMNSDPSSLEAILQDLLGDVPQDSSTAALPLGAVPSISISPDSGYTEMDTCLAALGNSPHSSTRTTPAQSPAGLGYYSNPSGAPSPQCPPGAFSPPVWGAGPVNHFYTKASTFSTSPPRYPTVPSTTTFNHIPSSSTAASSNSDTLHGLLSGPDLRGTLLS